MYKTPSSFPAHSTVPRGLFGLVPRTTWACLFLVEAQRPRCAQGEQRRLAVFCTKDQVNNIHGDGRKFLGHCESQIWSRISSKST